LRNASGITENKAVLDRSSLLTDSLFLERYVSIVWTRRRARDVQYKAKGVLGLLIFVVEKRSSKHRWNHFTFTRSLQNFRQGVKFNFSIATIRFVPVVTYREFREPCEGELQGTKPWFLGP
jgi:hypothetical protein